MKVLKHAHIFTGNEEINDGYLRFDSKIENLGHMEEYRPQADDEIIDVQGNYVIPGFIDVHGHGGYNYDVWDAEPS